MASTRSMDASTNSIVVRFPEGDIREELDRILDSQEFKASPRRRKMLRYLVEESAAGRAHLLKGYSIGVSVFGRGDDFDAQADPIVRLEARRLRRDLASYYIAEGRHNPLRISIPKGSYAPEVRRAERLAAESPAAQADAGPPSGDPGPSIGAGAGKHRMLLIWAGLVLAIATLVSFGYRFADNWRQDGNVASAVTGPAIIVWPFKVLGDNERDRYLADGISDQLITELGRFSDFRIYLPSPEERQNPTDDPLATSDRLGISFLVSGSVSSDASGVRIGARVVEVSSGRVLWSEDFDRALAPDSLRAAQAEIASAIASALGQPYGIIQTEITSRLPSAAHPSMSSYECVLRAYSYRRAFEPGLHAPVLACLEVAVKRDPHYAEAWAMLGWLYLDQGRFQLASGLSKAYTYGRALETASHAVALDARNALALKALASVNHYMGNFDEGERLQRQALALNPNDPDTLAQLGWRLAVRGKFAEGILYLNRAIERTVNPPGWYFHLVAIDHYLNGRYPEMLKAARHGAVDGSGISWSLVAIAEGALGDKAEAGRALDMMAQVSPRLETDPAGVYRAHGAIESIVDPLVAGLRNAGWSTGQRLSE